MSVLSVVDGLVCDIGMDGSRVREDTAAAGWNRPCQGPGLPVAEDRGEVGEAEAVTEDFGDDLAVIGL